MEKIRVHNMCKHDYGVITAKNMHINIRPGSFALQTEDDIAYIQSVTADGKKPFSVGKLVAERNGDTSVMEEIGIEKDEQNFLESDEQIDKRLKGTVASMKKWLDDITDPTLLFNIAERAKALDLPASKLKAIAEKVPNADLLE